MNKPEPHIIVIFGASGDLTKRKLIPALYDLFVQDLLPENFFIVGVGRTELSDTGFRDKMSGWLPNEAITHAKAEQFLNVTSYITIDTSDAQQYHLLKDKLDALRKQGNMPENYIYYLATPPSLYEKIAQGLTFAGINKDEEDVSWKRIIIEKPFGVDLDSARKLNKSLLNYFVENQIYRIDHYLGKETVQNVLVMRFANGIFEPLWNRNYVHHVEITSSEDLGLEGRGGYYDNAGALRDMVQNHLLQLVGIVAMEPPIHAESKAIRNETLKVFQSLRPIKEEEVAKYVIRGQYTGATMKGEHLPGYREEQGVSPESRTETYVAMKFFIDNWRWNGVPFYIRTGKRLPTKVTEIVIHFKKSPHHIFSHQYETINTHNQLVIRVQPDEGLLFKFGMKIPGAGFNVQNANMDFHYSDVTGVKLTSAYERLLLDCMQGDSTLYIRGDAVEEAWAFVQPILDAWKNHPDIPVYGYPAGTWGPEHADSLIEEPEITWRYPCKNLSNDGEYCEL
ncbi:MAG TPA: glucose-6-phosphate dehydrogenase [Marinilabiliales bacterium]|jgi:glucose-6-phosphate 1-dehydrogenase|nr:MAG: glucose-6-phosphate dehydrogenase [Bacteroidetes bacterium GWC2_40_13]HAZ00963.1 glucose-6-phosphate dehydrogenase [Marinilabiliales bacterium]